MNLLRQYNCYYKAVFNISPDLLDYTILQSIKKQLVIEGLPVPGQKEFEDPDFFWLEDRTKKFFLLRSALDCFWNLFQTRNYFKHVFWLRQNKELIDLVKNIRWDERLRSIQFRKIKQRWFFKPNFRARRDLYREELVLWVPLI